MTTAGRLDALNQATVVPPTSRDHRVANHVIAGQFDTAFSEVEKKRADRLPLVDRRDVVFPTTPFAPRADSPTTTQGQVNVLWNQSGTDFDLEAIDVGYGATAVAAGDFSGDDYHDIAVSNAYDNSISLLVNVPLSPPLPPGRTRSFTGSIAIGCGGVQPRDLVLADLNGDQKLDLVVANTTSNSVTYLRGLRPGGAVPQQFEAAVPIVEYDGSSPAMKGPIALLVEDIDGQAPDDLIVANFRSNTVTILINRTTDPDVLDFDPPVIVPVIKAPVRLAYDDITGDGIKDIVVANMLTSSVTPASQDLYDHSVPNHMTYSGNASRFLAWPAVAAPETENTAPPSVPRTFRSRLFVWDRLGGDGPQMLLPNDVIVDAQFRRFHYDPENPIDINAEVLRQIVLVVRNPADPLDPAKERLFYAVVSSE